MSDNTHILGDAETALTFILGGYARVVLKSLNTGDKISYKVTGKRKQGVWEDIRFVAAKGEEGFDYIGFFKPSRMDETKQPLIAGKAGRPGETSFKAFSWVLNHLNSGVVPAAVEIWHTGTCGRCGRELTDPVSIERGIGPICMNKGGY